MLALIYHGITLLILTPLIPCRLTLLARQQARVCESNRGTRAQLADLAAFVVRVVQNDAEERESLESLDHYCEHTATFRETVGNLWLQLDPSIS